MAIADSSGWRPSPRPRVPKWPWTHNGTLGIQPPRRSTPGIVASPPVPVPSGLEIIRNVRPSSSLYAYIHVSEVCVPSLSGSASRAMDGEGRHQPLPPAARHQPSQSARAQVGRRVGKVVDFFDTVRSGLESEAHRPQRAGANKRQTSSHLDVICRKSADDGSEINVASAVADRASRRHI
ncbi:hypothetical protein BD413DRAFT_196312 [Trametes elegans]|nr:hypothetical protein BD413DRAFT_196312 [Trametes elegans]